LCIGGLPVSTDQILRSAGGKGGREGRTSGGAPGVGEADGQTGAAPLEEVDGLDGGGGLVEVLHPHEAAPLVRLAGGGGALT